MKLSKKQRKRFEKYAPFYDLQGAVDDNNESSQMKVDREEYVYRNLLKKGLDMTAIKELTDMTKEEINTQYTRKSHIENRAGFLVALWGILLSVIMEHPIIITYQQVIGQSRITWIDIFISVLVVASGGVSLWFIVRTLMRREFRFFDFKDRENNYKCAVEDRELFWVTILESVSNVWERNEWQVNEKSEDFEKALRYVVIFAGTIFLGFCLRG